MTKILKFQYLPHLLNVLIYILRKVVYLLALPLRGEIMQWHVVLFFLFILFIYLFIFLYFYLFSYLSILLVLFSKIILFFWSILKVESRNITQLDACFAISYWDLPNHILPRKTKNTKTKGNTRNLSWYSKSCLV